MEAKVDSKVTVKQVVCGNCAQSATKEYRIDSLVFGHCDREKCRQAVLQVVNDTLTKISLGGCF
jgi:hypothetical protein